MPEQDLLQIKKKIQEATTEETKLSGQFIQLLKTLKEDFNCKDIKEGKEYLESIQKQISEKNRILKEGVSELKEELGW